MKKCDHLVDLGRRRFLGTGAVATAGAAAAACVPGENARADAPTGGALVRYPSTRLANIAELDIDRPLSVAYPDEAAPGVLFRFARAVEGGAGPERNVVGFSVSCPHQGYALAYNADDRTLNCPGHYSRFDPEAGGQQIWGQASQNLPQYLLRIDDNGDIFAEGLDELLYGRLSNTL